MPLTEQNYIDFFTFRLPADLSTRLREEQARLNVSLSHLIRTYIYYGLVNAKQRHQ